MRLLVDSLPSGETGGYNGTARSDDQPSSDIPIAWRIFTPPVYPLLSAIRQKINIFSNILRHSNHLSPPQVSLQLFTLAQHSNGWMGDTPLTGMTSYFTFITKKMPKLSIFDAFTLLICEKNVANYALL